MKRKAITLLALAATVALTFPAMAGSWQQDHIGWWYQNDDGSYPYSESQEIDGTWYEFDENGYWVQKYQQGYVSLSDFSEAEQQYLFTLTALGNERRFTDGSKLSIDDATEAILYSDGLHFVQWYDLIESEYWESKSYNGRAKAIEVKEAMKYVFYKDLDISPYRVTRSYWEKVGDYYQMQLSNGGARYEGSMNSIYSYGDGRYQISYRWDRSFREDWPRAEKGDFYGTCVVKRNEHGKYLFGLLSSEPGK